VTEVKYCSEQFFKTSHFYKEIRDVYLNGYISAMTCCFPS